MLNQKYALVVLSGGQDSVTCLFWALKHYNVVHAITFDYGQTHAIELEAARKACEVAGVPQHVVTVPGILKSSSPLTDPSVALDRYSSFEAMEQEVGTKIEKTFVPMRNTLFLTVAANYAVSLGFGTLITGVCQQDNANYPDCTEAFIYKLNYAFNESLGLTDPKEQLLIKTPLMYRSKANTVELMYELAGFDLRIFTAMAYSHTSYDGKYPPTDNNHSNLLRAQGFEDAGQPDPLVLRAWVEGLMELPDTANYDNVRNTMSKMRAATIMNLYGDEPLLGVFVKGVEYVGPRKYYDEGITARTLYKSVPDSAVEKRRPADTLNPYSLNSSAQVLWDAGWGEGEFH